MPHNRDKLTGLPDRNNGYALARVRVAEAHSNKQALASLWIDIDRFRTINHSFGHLGGDHLVATIAQRICTITAPMGELIRMSGDEFLAILPGANGDFALEISQAIQNAMVVPIEIDGITVHPTVSIGISLLEPREDMINLLLRADRAKTIAKRQGGNGIAISGEKLTRNGILLVREELEIESLLHTAMDSGGLSLHYQPVVRRDGSIEAVEALMRCQVGEVSLSPNKLIPVAEKTGLINRLGEWTLIEGAMFAKKLKSTGYDIKVSVNVSRMQLLAPRFVQALHGALMCAHIPPHLLELELTESLFLDTSSIVQNNLREAREAGVNLAIDDFGTGYSSLATLKDVPATKLKLDRSFIVVLPHDRKAIAVVRAITNLGRELGLTVVAEGVETEEQRQCLEQLGVDAIQGFLYSPPMPQQQLLAWLQTSRATQGLTTAP